MTVRTTTIAAALAGILAAGALPLRADVHVVTEMSRTYMGQNYPPRATEVWVGKDAAATRNRGITVIARFDRKTLITVSERSKKSFEEPLEPTAKSPSAPAPERIQEAGFGYYSPAYDWTVRETAEAKTIGGLACRRVVAIGDADFAEETREMWVASETPIDLAAYRAFVDRDPDPARSALAAASPLLRSGFVMEEKRTSEHSIAHTMTILFRTTVLESAAPPAGIYDPPPGYAKAKSLGEVYGR